MGPVALGVDSAVDNKDGIDIVEDAPVAPGAATALPSLLLYPMLSTSLLVEVAIVTLSN